VSLESDIRHILTCDSAYIGELRQQLRRRRKLIDAQPREYEIEVLEQIRQLAIDQSATLKQIAANNKQFVAITKGITNKLKGHPDRKKLKRLLRTHKDNVETIRALQRQFSAQIHAQSA